jgi:hypothetical protein
MTTARRLYDIEALATQMCEKANQHMIAPVASTACSWLHACGYQGLQLLQEALHDDVKSLPLVKDALGMDLQNVSCLYLMSDLQNYVQQHGRIFLRNVRHGLFLVPDSVNFSYAIGCPIDPSFALGGERLKNPYAEKLQNAALHGVDIEEDIWAGLQGAFS